MFQFELDQLIFYMIDSKVHSAKVLSRMGVDNLHEDFDSSKEQRETFQQFGKTGVLYGTCHGAIKAENAFATKEELLKSL